MHEVLVRRRVFLATLAASMAAMGARVALLPRGLSDDAIARLESQPAPPPPLRAFQQAPPVAPAPSSAADEVDLSGSMANLNPLAQNLELAPHITRFRPHFKINTVERQPQKALASREAWTIQVEGLVERPFELTPLVLRQLPPASLVADFHCVEGWGVQDVRWEGVRLADVLRHAGVLPEGRFVTFQTLGGIYTDSLALDQAAHPDTLLATHINGSRLPDRQGFPVRLVVPFMFGYKSVKWVSRLTLEVRRHVGFWERRGWQLDPYV